MFRLVPTVLLLSLALLTGCGDTPPSPPGLSGCEQGWAVVLVGDGYLRSLCGCQEPRDPVSRGVFTCTVAAGSAVAFQRIGAKGRHQILSSGGNFFVSSPILDNGPKSVSTHVTAVLIAGTYEFLDPFLPGISGRIIAQ